MTCTLAPPYKKPCEQRPPFVFLSERKKSRLCLNCFMPWKALQPELLDYSILSSLVIMLNKNLTQFMQSLSQVRQNQVSKRKTLLAAGCQQALFSCSPLVKIINAYSTVFLPVFDTAVACGYSIMVLLHSSSCQRCTY